MDQIELGKTSEARKKSGKAGTKPIKKLKMTKIKPAVAPDMSECVYDLRDERSSPKHLPVTTLAGFASGVLLGFAVGALPGAAFGGAAGLVIGWSTGSGITDID